MPLPLGPAPPPKYDDASWPELDVRPPTARGLRGLYMTVVTYLERYLRGTQAGHGGG